VQVDPIKPKLKLPRTKRLKLQCDEPLSKFAFKFNLRRYTMARAACLNGCGWTAPINDFLDDTSDHSSINNKRRREVGPGIFFSPRHPKHLEQSFIELNDILRRGE